VSHFETHDATEQMSNLTLVETKRITVRVFAKSQCLVDIYGGVLAKSRRLVDIYGGLFAKSRRLVDAQDFVKMPQVSVPQALSL
jgi:hypothetical protein